MSIADEASAGIGFISPIGDYSFADYVFQLHRTDVLKRKRITRLQGPNLPVTLCWMVPAFEACVQPKARTPQVGCTLSTLSHNLALLPPKGEITTSWLFGAPAQPVAPRTLNLLLVPFPFRIDGGCFSEEYTIYGEGKARFFSVEQKWLKRGKNPIKAGELSNFFVGLIRKAKQEVRDVHGLVLPELALHESQIRDVARQLARRTNLELFISGVLGSGRGRDSLPQNKVYTSIFFKNRILTEWTQSKHHRWRLDGRQVRRYHLGDALDPGSVWWEKIELLPRTCTFYVFRYGASMAALVCEDLARIDPVQVALRSVGPNLVVVLLLDGPQLERRWPGRYATVLADDPGSAVLTLTSFGMVRRSVMPGEEERREIALWKEPSEDARELKLPKGSHGLLLTLTQSYEENFSLDGRSDDENTIGLSLSGVRGVSHPKPPKWLDSGPYDRL